MLRSCLVSLLATLVVSGPAASAACPTRADVAEGLILERNSAPYATLRLSDAAVMHMATVGAAVEKVQILDHGILPMSGSWGGLHWHSVDGDLGQLAGLHVGDTLAVGGTVTEGGDAALRPVSARFKVLAGGDADFGGCSYHSLWLEFEATVARADGTDRKLGGWVNYLPDLMIAWSGMHMPALALRPETIRLASNGRLLSN